MYRWIRGSLCPVIADDLVMLHEIDAVGLEASKRLIQLSRRLDFRPSVDLCHQEDVLPVAIAQRIAHPYFARAVVVIPAVVEEVDAAIDRVANNPDAESFVELFEPEMPSAQAYGGYALSCMAEDSVRHLTMRCGR